MKALKTFTLMIASMLVIYSFPTMALANNYNFKLDYDTGQEFGSPTHTEESADYSDTENVRRNKDATSFPPGYGIFSGEFPTQPTSPYHGDGVGENTGVNGSDLASATITYETPYNPSDNTAAASTGNGYITSTSMYEVTNTMPWYYDDGSIGKLKIPAIGVSVKVYEGANLDTMKSGAGHFEYTSAWDGNIGIGAHNRGTNAYFNKVKNLKNGDEITYTTLYGTRTYRVFLKEKISDTDTTYLSWSSENIITLITCSENEPNMRWCVQAREVK